jgi:hypothetical protein
MEWEKAKEKEILTFCRRYPHRLQGAPAHSDRSAKQPMKNSNHFCGSPPTGDPAVAALAVKICAEECR